MVPRNIKQKQDGKIKTEDFLYEYYKNLKQKLAYKPGFTNHEFRSWQDAVRENLKR